MALVIVASVAAGAGACSQESRIDPAWTAEVSERLPDPAVRGDEAFASVESADLLGRFLETSLSSFESSEELTPTRCGDLVDSLVSEAPAEELFRSASSVRDRALSQLTLNARQQVGAYLSRCVGEEPADGGQTPGAADPRADTTAPGASLEVVRESLRLAAGRYREVRG